MGVYSQQLLLSSLQGKIMYKSNLSAGFTLIEMLVALSIFAIILLGLIQMACQSAQTINQDYFQEKKVMSTHSLYESHYK